MADAGIDTKEGKLAFAGSWENAFAESWESICSVMSSLKIVDDEPVQRKRSVISAWRTFRANREDMEMLAQNRNYGSPFALMLASGMDECVFALKMTSQRRLRMVNPRKLKSEKTIDTGLAFFFPVRDCNFTVFANVSSDAAVDEYVAAGAELADFTANRTSKKEATIPGKKVSLVIETDDSGALAAAASLVEDLRERFAATGLHAKMDGKTLVVELGDKPGTLHGSRHLAICNACDIVSRLPDIFEKSGIVAEYHGKVVQGDISYNFSADSHGFGIYEDNIPVFLSAAKTEDAALKM